MRTILVSAILAGSVSLALAQAPETMIANLANTDGEGVGTVTFEAMPSGLLRVIVEVSGVPEGVRGFHVHEVGACDAADGFQSAGGHYAGGHDHGLVEEGPHVGDFPNLHVPESGVLTVEYFTHGLSLGSDGENPLVDADGSAVVVHADPDDYVSQPSGNAGDRIACGVIE